MTPADDFAAVPPFEIRAPRRPALALRLQLAAQRPPLSGPLPGLDPPRPNAIRRSEDCYVDELFGAAVPLGAPLLAANFPRAYLDVNREP